MTYEAFFNKKRKHMDIYELLNYPGLSLGFLILPVPSTNSDLTWPQLLCVGPGGDRNENAGRCDFV